ncbi:hypothetical protein DSO57_1018016 [Entomophthora muscae]|uniref:Uncharacterized protein n=1 Tax=Entomophthora muscae TaxID=34485 RepID=A0ACC2TFV4_9FUNG|nr:hypothetical protein DSO57_1018016 [Entomophthora muscae]
MQFITLTMVATLVASLPIRLPTKANVITAQEVSATPAQENILMNQAPLDYFPSAFSPAEANDAVSRVLCHPRDNNCLRAFTRGVNIL